MANKNRTIGIEIDKDWEADDAMRTLMRACEIRKDKKLMAKVKAMATQRLQEVAAIAGASEGDSD